MAENTVAIMRLVVAPVAEGLVATWERRLFLLIFCVL